MELHKKLDNIKTYPFHMPGHKRNAKFNILGSNIDITEIDGYDDLHNPKSYLLDLESKYRKLYKSKKSIISVNGSTCCILSAISAVCNEGDKIIIARNCHKSVYNACYINKLKVEYIDPSVNKDFNCFNAITQQNIDSAISKNPDAKAIVLTSPTYEGICSNVSSPIPLIIDSAHGAHFGFNSNFPNYPKADIVISSLHKTLPALTQAAILNIYNSKYANSIKKYMDIYETSSPSYLIMNSVDICADFLENSNDDFDNLYHYCNEFIHKVNKNLSTFKILENDDNSRLCIKSTKINGNKLADALRNEHNIEIEMSCFDYIILITTVGDDKYAFEMLYEALYDINKITINLDDIDYTRNLTLTLPDKYCENYEIAYSKTTKFSESDGKICCEYIYAYPPGIPIIVPGEIITKEIINYINSSLNSGTNIISESSLVEDKILTK